MKMKWTKTSYRQQYAKRDGFFYTISKFGSTYLLTKTPENQETTVAITRSFETIKAAKESVEDN